jgi:hypothetical protein
VGTLGCPFKFDHHVLVGARRSAATVPGPPIEIRCVCDFGEGAVHATTVLRLSDAVNSGPDERMCEVHPALDLEQAGIDCRHQGRHVDAEDISGTLEQRGVADRLRRRSEEEQLGVGGQSP